MSLKRNKKGEIIWPQIDKSTQSKIVHSMKDKYRAAGMWRSREERELFGTAEVEQAFVEHRIYPRSPREDDDGVCLTNDEVRRAGWCPECKQRRDECTCRDAGIVFAYDEE